MISKLGVIKPKANGEQYPECGVLSDIPERKWGASDEKYIMMH
jgi:hypothetical protein